MSNAFRNNAAQGGERYFAGNAADITKKLTQDCGWSEELITKEGSRPKFLHVNTVEFNRIKAWACAGYEGTECSHGMPPSATTDRFGVPSGRDAWLEDQPDVWPFGNPIDANYKAGWVNGGHLSGASYVTYGDATEQIGGPPYIESCGHFAGFFEPKRPLGAISFYPRASWSAADPLNEATYGIGVQLQLGSSKDAATGWGIADLGDFQLWATQPWNNVGLNTYQPIPSGVHLVVDTGRGTSPHYAAFCHNCERANRVLRFVAQYYDSSGMPPTAFEVLLDGVATPMQLVVGKSWRGTYEYEHPGLGPSVDAACISYVFRATNERGTFFLPQSGRFVFRTYGIGSCKEFWKPQSCTTRGVCRASCGFPGMPCGSVNGGGSSSSTTNLTFDLSAASSGFVASPAVVLLFFLGWRTSSQCFP